LSKLLAQSNVMGSSLNFDMLGGFGRALKKSLGSLQRTSRRRPD
jgi:hypothetical protein